MIDRDELVKLARSYLGTPFQHQGRMRDVGVDCRGLVSCLAYDAGISDVRIDDYSRQPDPARFRAEVRKHMDPIDFKDLLPGDAVTFFWGNAERHFGFVSSINPLMIIHAYEPLGKVVEQPVDNQILLRIRGCWRFKEVGPWQS